MNIYDEFPSLSAKETQLKSDIGRIDREIKDIETSERFTDNEAERTYQLEKLAEEKEATLTAAQDDFNIELQAIELHLAEQAFEPPQAGEEEITQAQALTNAVTTQVVTSSNIVDTLSLLALRTKSMNDTEKLVLKRELATIQDTALSKTVGPDSRGQAQAKLDEITANVSDTKQSKEIEKQLQALKKIQSDGYDSIRRKFDRDDLIKRTLRGGTR